MLLCTLAVNSFKSVWSTLDTWYLATCNTNILIPRCRDSIQIVDRWRVFWDPDHNHSFRIVFFEDEGNRCLNAFPLFSRFIWGKPPNLSSIFFLSHSNDFRIQKKVAFPIPFTHANPDSGCLSNGPAQFSTHPGIRFYPFVIMIFFDIDIYSCWTGVGIYRNDAVESLPLNTLDEQWNLTPLGMVLELHCVSRSVREIFAWP